MTSQGPHNEPVELFELDEGERELLGAYVVRQRPGEDRAVRIWQRIHSELNGLNGLNGLDEGEHRLLGAYARGQLPGEDRAARVWRRIAHRVSADAAKAQPESKPAARWPRLGAGLLAVAAAAVAALSIGRSLTERPTPHPPNLAPHTTPKLPTEGHAQPRALRRATSPDRAAEGNTPSPSADPPLSRLSSQGRSSVANPGKRPRSVRSSTGANGVMGIPGADAAASSLNQETELIERARKALASRKPDVARAWLRQHAQHHPHGVLEEEREALDVVAQCKMGEGAASLALERFTTRFPGSPHIRAVRTACPNPNEDPAG